jgi:hypothetical protein
MHEIAFLKARIERLNMALDQERVGVQCLIDEAVAVKNAEIEKLREAIVAKCRQYDDDMQTMQKALNAEIEARRAAEAEIERLTAELATCRELREYDRKDLAALRKDV